MAVREFVDSRNIMWRVWDVTTAQMHPVTKREDFMGDLADGWLAFESATEKRRLAAPYPANWMEMSTADLEALCQQALPVVIRHPRSISGEQRIAAVEELEAGAAAVRTFTSPRGRVWTVRLHECPTNDGATMTVLRFTSDDIVIDLTAWPPDWKDYTATQYAMLILDAAPPRPLGARGPQRRREDRRDEDRPIGGRPT
jgi:DNA-binding helix-hairpin-helix protein with protein kinase domain